MSCVLRLEGEGFDVHGFLAHCGITAYQVWEAGEQDALGRTHRHAGCKEDVSSADLSDLAGQVKEAIDFLSTHASALSELTRFGLPAECGELDFAIETRMFDVGVQTDRFPALLLKLAGNAGLTICLSQYPPATEDR